MYTLDQPPESICLLRLSALGDATHTVPVIRALKQAWPETHITWVIGKLERRLLTGIDGIEFIEFNKRDGWEAIRSLRKTVRDRRFDVLLHMQVSARANLLSRFIRAPVRLGWDTARSRDGHHWFVRQQVRSVPFQHQVQAFLEFPRALGVAVDEPIWDLPIAEEARAWVDSQIDPGDRTLIISPCSSHAARNWDSESYAAIADIAKTDFGLNVILSGGPSALERDMAEAIESKMSTSCLNLVGKDTLEQSKAMLDRADLVITPDSGPAHIASALKTPVIGLHAATWSIRSGPYNSLDLCVDRFEQAAKKFRDKPASELRWGTRIEVPGVMDLIQADDVVEKIDQWDRSGPGR